MNMLKYAPVACCLLQASFALPLNAQVAFEDNYTQDFDSLPLYESSSGTAVFNFTNNSTLDGWYSSVGNGVNEARSSGGAAASSGSLYNWGRTADRALGTFDADGYGSNTVYFGVVLQNNSGATIDSLNVSYVIEQWRKNSNVTTWNLEYLVTADSGNAIGSSGYTTVPGSTLESTVGSAGGSNGNYSGNQNPFDLDIDSIGWSNGDYLWLRWSNDQGADSGGLGLDNLNVSQIPESSSTTLILCVPLLFLLLRRFARKSA
ncbi:endonuclease [Cerasicoccus arenae]|uniref:PEP-CTERM sorting domain-containing protein n=1 Tax=Cerasicoccus arenae TaxID=424488 RepID=A0A8J3GEC1_9BACT|nr:endonuclease [Cerasicoccus arenae]MBK1859281.1 hypothetical protein [Cerasicoccus arenae]GHC13308.1 hypothetical protein GCM10007047_33290 [Cerasicoccus arenae]